MKHEKEMNQIKEALTMVYIGEHKPFYGLCDVIKKSVGFSIQGTPASRLVITWMKDWPKFSGVESCPVPHPIMHPYSAFINTVKFYDTETKYGRNRIELAGYLIKRIQTYLGEEPNLPVIVKPKWYHKLMFWR